MRPLLGAITGDDPEGYLRFARWLGHRPPLALMSFNQTGLEAFRSSIPWAVAQARKFIALGADMMWSVPFPGRGQLEAIVAGVHDSLYRDAAVLIAAASPDSGPIWVRLPWEFNLEGQENAARDARGRWDPGLFVAAWTRLVRILRGISMRFRFVWCPGILLDNAIDPEACWPGGENVDIVAGDFYMSRRWHTPGAFLAFRRAGRGLDWMVDFAGTHGKSPAVSEYGFDDDRFVGDFEAMAEWLKGLRNLHHHLWWDRPEVIDCRISNGMHPCLGAAYRREFA